MRILLGRHAESDGNVDAQNYVKIGDARTGITEQGCRQAIAMGEFLADYYKNTQTVQWPSIFVSSYLRPQQTFRGVYEGIRDNFIGEPKLKEDVRLIEKFFGAASHLAFADDKVDPDVKRALEVLSKRTYLNDAFSASHLFGESTLNTFVRAKQFIEGTLARDIEEGQDDFLIMTHGAVIQAFIMAWAHLPMASKGKLGNPNNCDVIVIEGEPKNWTIRKVYDGEAMKPVDIDLVASIDHLSVQTLPPLPHQI
ncbi:MAG: hypothetical protein CMH31_01665 [Micavibrio sp.]|mgnify:CR=1 FL=1|nr:hypothetical protein [Micavibrio sp.]|tara:strand:- start:100 stop:858 length:759 start_codon:yes stop_codon:yes gene_type:complete